MTDATARPEMADPDTIALAVERLDVQRIRTDARRVVVRTETVTSDEVISQPLEQAEVEVTRVPVGRDVDSPPEIRVEGEVTIFPVLEERLVLTRQLVLKEEIHIRTRRSTTEAEVPATLRHQRAIVEKFDGDTGALLSQDVLS